MEYTVHSVEELEQILNKRHAEHCTVFLQAGRYPITKTLELGSNLSLKAQGDVFFDGGILLDKRLAQPYKNNILRIDLAPYGLSLGEYGNRGFRRAYVNAPNELFVDGEAYTVARYPKINRIP